MTAKQLLTVVAVSAATTFGSIWGYGEYEQYKQLTSYEPAPSIFKQASFVEGAVAGPTVDFEKAATKAAPAVVHIKVNSNPKQVAQHPNPGSNPFEDFFGDMFGQRGQSMPAPQRRGSGSGVLISADG